MSGNEVDLEIGDADGCIKHDQGDRKLIILYLAIFYCFKFIRS